MSKTEWKITRNDSLLVWDGKWRGATGAEAATILRSALEAERESIKAIVADHAALGCSFGVEDICDKIIAAINARSERKGDG